MSASNDDSESVDQFLARIASLSRKNEEQDDGQARKMEEDMMQARKERQARRAERARSISPVKTGPAASSLHSPHFSTSRERPIDPPVTLTPRSQTQTPSRTGPSPQNSFSERLGSSPPFESVRQLPQPPSPEHPPSPSFPATGPSTLSRSGTLSWQQRPLSRGLGSVSGSVRGRPSPASRSPVRTLPASPKSTANDRDEPEPSRREIAASLASRDPAWFRQTQDRGDGSAAYRKTTSPEPTHESRLQSGMRLPGMAQEKADATTTEWRSYDQERPMAKKEETDTTASRDLRSNFESMSKEGTVRPAQTAPLVSKPLFDANDSKPSDVHGAAEAESTLGHTSSIMGGGRSPSPTKGLGGFVQSAMMRRSDSVSKRWSVQANSGLKRGDSVAGNRPVFSPLTAAPAPLGHARTLSREPRALRDGTSSPLSGSRPSSSHDQVQQDHLLSQALRPSSQVSNTPDMVQNKTSPTIPEHRPSTPPSSEPTLGRSPSKTMDPRRWSPTKASWLESALSKPESPRPAPLKPEPPTWKLDMQRSKSQKDLQESLTRPTSSFDPVSTGSLLRSPPPGTESKPPPLFGDTISKQTRPVAAPARLDDRKDTEAKQQSFSKVSTTPSSEQSRTLKEPALENASTRTEAADRKPEHMTEPTSKPDFRTSQNRQIPALKPKPQTPPKTDFRASLKCRQTGNADSADNEPEFKAVFGKLKKAQTQNYVAPDMLKANISRGKAALTVTGGPQQTKRVDEFKESILAKKDAMKQGGGSIHKKTNTDVQEKPVADVPEALARRKTLSKAKPSMDADSIEPLHTQRSIVDKTAPETKSIPASRFESKPAPERGSRPEPIKATIKPEVAEKGKEAAVVAPVRGLTGVSDQPKTFKAPTEQQERCPSPVKNGPDTLSGKLAARMNPALASLIARGGSPRPQPESVPSDTVTEMGVVKTQSAETPSGDLQHMTKGRAKGPKRRAPKAETKIALDETTQSAISTPPVTKAVSAPVQEQSPVKSAWKTSAETGSVPLPKSSPVKARFTAPTPVRESKPPGAVDSPTPRTPSDNSPGPRARPAVASKSPELRRVSNKESAVEAKEDRPLSRPTTNNKTFDIATDVTSHEPPSKTKTPVREMIGKQEARSLPLTPSKSRMNSPPKSLDMPYANLSPGKIKPKAAGLGLTMNESAKKTMTADVLTPPPESDMAFRARNTLSPAKAKETTQVSKIIQTHFGTLPRSADRGDFDTEAYLKAQSSETAREKTLNKQIWEVTGDGKRTALPPGQDHILYEECMYLCVHTFENEKGSRTSEANLWTGDAVSDAAIEDAQLFCRKIARENSAKLEVVRQGKETSKFFSALGGIVIIRKTKSSALYMLCGRRHHGHVAFDEVEMSAARLCSGFPFLLSAKFGKLYLWKGQGSGVDEISAAKLISMDLSLTDEVEEISEGSEPPSFWENFADAKAFQPSEMWSVRSMDQQKGFPCRLYRLEPERPKSSGGFWGLRAASPPKASNKVTLQEISSFTQKDLDPGSVHILDAYANIYVIPSSSTASKATDFVSALFIAQEMAVLAPSVQDRSLLPSSEVVFGEPPRDFQAAFRKWTSGLNVDKGKDSACIDVAEVLRVLD